MNRLPPYPKVKHAINPAELARHPVDTSTRESRTIENVFKIKIVYIVSGVVWMNPGRKLGSAR